MLLSSREGSELTGGKLHLPPPHQLPCASQLTQGAEGLPSVESAGAKGQGALRFCGALDPGRHMLSCQELLRWRPGLSASAPAKPGRGAHVNQEPSVGTKAPRWTGVREQGWHRPPQRTRAPEGQPPLPVSGAGASGAGHGSERGVIRERRAVISARPPS